eukprot:6207198-Pleurochrysis_carterae.AAC.3
MSMIRPSGHANLRLQNFYQLRNHVSEWIRSSQFPSKPFNFGQHLTEVCKAGLVSKHTPRELDSRRNWSRPCQRAS